MIKWSLAIAGVAVVCDLLMGDPLHLRRIDLSAIYQQVRNVAENLAGSEYRQILSSTLPKR